MLQTDNSWEGHKFTLYVPRPEIFKQVHELLYCLACFDTPSCLLILLAAPFRHYLCVICNFSRGIKAVLSVCYTTITKANSARHIIGLNLFGPGVPLCCCKILDALHDSCLPGTGSLSRNETRSLSCSDFQVAQAAHWLVIRIGFFSHPSSI